MRGTWASLFYRELHEQKWRSLSLTVIMVSIAANTICACVLDRPGAEDATITLTMMAFAGIPGALFIAMGVAGGERSAGTVPQTA